MRAKAHARTKVYRTQRGALAVVPFFRRAKHLILCIGDRKELCALVEETKELVALLIDPAHIDARENAAVPTIDHWDWNVVTKPKCQAAHCVPNIDRVVVDVK